MKALELPLAGKTVLEYAGGSASRGIVQSIAMAGRLAQDFGAEVIVIREQEDLLDRHEIAFLDRGKSHLPASWQRWGDRRIDAVLVDADMAGIVRSADIRVIFHAMQKGGAAPASEFTAMAKGGLLDVVGEPDREPLRLGGHQLAYSTGLTGYTALIAGFCHDEPVSIDVGMLETAVWLNWKAAAATRLTGEAPHRQGEKSEWRTIRCADGYVAIVYENADWANIVELADDDFLRNPEFKDRAGRVRASQAIAGALEAAFLKRTRAELRDISLEKRLPFGPVWAVNELRNDRHLASRKFMSDGPAGTVMRPPILWNGESLADS